MYVAHRACATKMLRDRLFKVGEGAMVLFGENIPVGKFDGNKISVPDMDRKNIMKVLYDWKNFMTEKNLFL